MTAPSNRHRAVRSPRGFTLLEVMFALAILGFGLTVVIKSAAGNIFNAQQAHMIGVVTDLARGKMYDIEDKLIKDGFSDTEVHEEDQAFADEGWPLVKYSYKIEVVELPSWQDLQAIAQGHAGSGAGSGSGSAASSKSTGSADLGSDGIGSGSSVGGFADSALGGMLSQFGGFGLGGGGGKSGAGAGSGDINSSIGNAFVQSQYTMFQQILKVSIRKVTLTVKWQVLGSDRDMTIVTFQTDAASMDKVISGMGSQDLDDANAKSGSGSGSGSSKPGTPTTGGRTGSGSTK